MNLRTITKNTINPILESAFGLKLYSTRSSAWDMSRLPKRIWGTKGFEFWTFLSLLLHLSRCSSILELGSGRSTLTFTEYAKFQNAQFISIETREEWFEKWKFELRFLNLNLPGNPVHLLKRDLATGWYDLKQFREVTGNGTIFDFVMIDGPNDEGNFKEVRGHEVATQEIGSCAENADVVIIDDVHQKHVFDTIDRILVQPDQYDKWFYKYYYFTETNVKFLVVSSRKSSLASLAMPKIRELLGISLYPLLNREQCPED